MKEGGPNRVFSAIERRKEPLEHFLRQASELRSKAVAQESETKAAIDELEALPPGQMDLVRWRGLHEILTEAQSIIADIEKTIDTAEDEIDAVEERWRNLIVRSEQ